MKSNLARFLVLSLYLILGPFTAHADESLTDQEFAEVLPYLLSHLPDSAALKDKNLTPESLTQLLPTLGVWLSADPLKTTGPEPFKAELLPSLISYWRAGTFSPVKGVDLDTITETSLRGDTLGLILDLRDNQSPNDYEGAAHLAKNLAPLGTVLFSLQGVQTQQQVFQISQQKLLYSHPVVILINRHTAGAAEALAAALRRSIKAILVGKTTQGLGGVIVEAKLKSGRYLRLSTSEATLPDGTKLLSKPVQPDLPVFVDDEAEAEALAQIRLGPAAKGLLDGPFRKHMSEAALVREENPEIDDALKKSGKHAENETVSDTVLLRAVDVLMGIRLIYP